MSDQHPPSSSTIHPDIIRTHILTRLDGATLASASCASRELNSMSSREELWANICHATWPSTDDPRLSHVISTFPDGPRSFFSNAFPLIDVLQTSTSVVDNNSRPSELISAVDIHYRDNLIFTKVVETETVSAWFRCSPFRIDMLEPKDTCPTPVPHPETEDSCRELAEELTLSWILIDPSGRRAVNLSSHKPVIVQRHWLSGEVHARFAAIVGGERGTPREVVNCGIVVTWGGGGEGRGMQVREVSLQVEDAEGMYLDGKDSLVILKRALESRERRKRIREEGARRRFEEFVEKKRERKERMMRREGRLDMLCVTFGVFLFASLGLFLVFR
ncbi:hypothetical protein K2173_018589 [Erythroxylum novogranatense]|uniref:F-box domain-containing protein n=1 Tax=Erythroxylum novogranatense TaxID=1862640 RepID=A0AAV8UB19_9ROSI|nr:hypothetical protein K2173_018589 [Erythroxylum novogranatense]